MKLLLFIGFTIFVNQCFSQLKMIEILIRSSDSEIVKYLDSLDQLTSTPHSKIQKDVNQNGDLVIKKDFSQQEEPFYKCRNISFIMQRVAGIEICSSQIIGGSVQFASEHLTFIKDLFNKVGDNKWELVFPERKWGIIATFERKEASGSPYFIIKYDTKSF